jgi:hypothetical protein
MIYLKTATTTIPLLEKTSKSQPFSYNVYHQTFTDMNDGQPLGLEAQEILVNLRPLDLNIPFQTVTDVSFDNVTWQKVIAIKVLDVNLPFKGAHYPLTLRILASPLRIGTAHASGDKWGLASTTLANAGNHQAYAKLIYYAPRYYFSLLQKLVDFAGSSITFTNAASKIYGGVSYPANTPVFDEGLVVLSGDVPSLTIPNYTSGTILLKIKWKTGTVAHRYIFTSPTFNLCIDKSTQKITLEGGPHNLSCSYNNTAYEAGQVYLIGLQWTASHTYLAVAKWDSTNLTFEAASIATANEAVTTTFGVTYLGYVAASPTQFLGDAISDFILYDYQVASWTTAKYVLGLSPLQFNDFYITNKTAGIITYDSGKLVDGNGNDITGLTSGMPMVDGTIAMSAGLSAKWSAEIDDTYFP